MLSIVIPTLDADGELRSVLCRVAEVDLPIEIIVADGGSSDVTRNIARASGARVVTAPPGRGGQLAAGAEAAVGSWLLFLHADTRPGDGWAVVIKRFIANPDNAYRAGYFLYALDDPAPAAKRLERLVNWRCRTFGLPYGDQALLISRTFYDHLGGFKEIPLMEDVELVRRIGRSRLIPLSAIAVTSASRYRREGYLVRPVLNLFCLGLYFLGLPPAVIERIYRWR